MEKEQIQSLIEQLNKLKVDKEKFNAKTLEEKGYPIWLIRQHNEFLITKPKEIEKLLLDEGITDFTVYNIEGTKKKNTKFKKRTYRSKKT